MMSEDRAIAPSAALRSLGDAITDGVVVRAADGSITWVNRAFLTMIGFDIDEVIGTRPPHAWWVDADADAGISVAGERYLSGVAAGDRTVYRRKSGAVFPALLTSSPLYDDDGRRIGTVGTIRDAGDWASVEQQLTFQSQLINRVQAAVVATDAAGRIILWSAGAEDLFGYRSPDMLGRDFFPLLVVAAGEPTIRAILERLSTGESWEGELIVPLYGGGSLPVLTAISLLPADEHGPAGYVIVSVDLSERKRAEARIAAQYEVARVLASAESMADGIHEVLAEVGSAFAWDVGVFWAPGSVTEDLQCIDIWSTPGIELVEFELESRRGAPADGVVARVWRQHDVVWIADIATDTGFKRAASAQAAGLRSGVAFPVETEGRLLGVMEFYARQAELPDESLIATVLAVGRQVGQFIERRKAVASLRESEGRFRMMAESIPVMLWMTSATGHLEYVNRVWREFTGRPVERDLGDGWVENLHPDDRARAITVFRTAFNAQTFYEIDYRLRRRDGDYRWVLATGIPRVDADGAFRGYIGTCIDIDARRRNEENQRFLSEATRVLASSLDFHTTLASVARLAVPAIADWCVISIVDDDGQLRRQVAAHVDPERVDSAEILGERFPDDPELESALDYVMRTGKPRVYSVVTDEMLAATADDDEHLELLQRAGFASAMVVPIIARDRTLGVISLVRAEHGRHYGTADLELAQHLAHRSAVAIDNSRLYREAQESARARDQFLAVAAHELRSPLTSMKGFAQLLLRRARKSDASEEWLTSLQTVDAQVNRMTELVNRLLDVSRIGERSLRIVVAPTDLHHVVVEAVDEAQMATDNHTVRYTGVEEPISLDLDAARVTQVLANLLDNAIRYSPPGTTVTVDLQRGPEGGAIVSVRDDGPGVPAHLAERLFERYFRGEATVRSTTDGLGLGLYVANGIIEAHGGTISVESDGSHGATFRVFLPEQPSATPGPEEA